MFCRASDEYLLEASAVFRQEQNAALSFVWNHVQESLPRRGLWKSVRSQERIQKHFLIVHIVKNK